MELDFEVTSVFENIENAFNDGYRYIINQGGSRSSKTWSLCQFLIIKCLTIPKLEVDIIRKTFPTLRDSAMKDFLDILKDMDIYTARNHNKTHNSYEFDNGTVVRFYSADDDQKLRGRKRDLLWINEANELTAEDMRQLIMRTTGTVFLDFNPSEGPRHWIYEYQKYVDAITLKSTYKDNPFLSDVQINEIERFKDIDPEYYKIYGLGEPARTKEVIYTNWRLYNGDIPDGDIIYGLDFGFNNPTALVKINNYDGCNYVEEVIYESNLTTSDLIKRMDDLGIPKNVKIIADGARPEAIKEISNARFNIKSADKSVIDGINSVKRSPLYVNENSKNIILELNNYKWTMKGDEVLDIPTKKYDHALDAMRYAIYYRSKNKPSDYMSLLKASGYRR